MASASLYKTPDEYLLAMIARVQALGSKITDFNEGSVARTLFEAFAVGLSNQSLVSEQLRLDSFLATATGDALTTKALDYQVQRLAAVQATGTVRIERVDTSTAITIPAGWGSLVTVPAPGQPPVAYVTTADATMGIGVSFVEVAGRAVDGGVDANVSQGSTDLLSVLPVNPIAGVSTESGFFLKGPWTSGVDEETDDALRARVPIVVQGRVKGQEKAFLAAALSIAGVSSAQVLKAGDARDDASIVPGGTVELYYKGDSSLLAAVTDAVAGAAVVDQTAATYQATSERIIAAFTVYYLPGVDIVQLSSAVVDAIVGAVNTGTVGGITRYVTAIDAVHDVPGVESIGIPFAQFRRNSESVGTAHDLVMPPGHYANLDVADVTVTLTSL